MNKLICCIAIVLTFASCSKKSTPTPTPIPKLPVNTTPPTPYTITEDFELSPKSSYTIADVSLKTGFWSFNDALLGQSTEDAKIGAQSVRLRNGMLAMNFAVDSLKMIKFSHAQFGSDGPSTFTIWYTNDSGRSYQQLGGPISNLSTSLVTDSLEISGNNIQFQIRKTGDARMNLDNFVFKGAGNSRITIHTNPTTDPGSGGGTGGNTTSDVPPASGDDSNLLFGNPSNATADVVNMDNYLIDQKYYIESYSNSRGIPNWTAWHLDINSMGSTARQNDFRAFTGLPSGFYYVQNTSYSGSGFDRGHNCPSADRTSSVAANSSTFYMTNMIPQAPQNNQQTWGNLENYIRDFVKLKGDEVYIIMGSYGKGGTGSNGTFETIDNDHITIPSHVWKVAIILPKGNNDLSRVDANTIIIAVDTPNINTTSSDWTQYITTVDAIEQATGYDLLSALPTALQTTLQAKKYTP